MTSISKNPQQQKKTSPDNRKTQDRVLSALSATDSNVLILYNDVSSKRLLQIMSNPEVVEGKFERGNVRGPGGREIEAVKVIGVYSRPTSTKCLDDGQ